MLFASMNEPPTRDEEPLSRTPARAALGLAQRVVFGSSPRADSAYGARVSFAAEGAEVARAAVASGKPMMIARFGSTELACVNYFTRWRAGRAVELRYLKAVRSIAWTNSGIFPTDDASLDTFCRTYLEALRHVDVLGVWFNLNEDRIVDRYCPGARLVQLEALNPVLHERPWNSELAGKTVLVVHPFASTIESQYHERRGLLFSNPRVLPEFELKTLKAVQTIAGSTGGFSSWSEALDAQCEQVASIDFDVAVIGAGAYGLPLAAFVKQMGRTAVHLGGQTQLLFGIRGRRWEVESPDDIAPLFNEHWVRPSAEETPERSDAVEGGCYW